MDGDPAPKSSKRAAPARSNGKSKVKGKAAAKPSSPVHDFEMEDLDDSDGYQPPSPVAKRAGRKTVASTRTKRATSSTKRKSVVEVAEVIYLIISLLRPCSLMKKIPPETPSEHASQSLK